MLLKGHYQLLVVTTPDWEAKQGVLRRFERANDDSDWTSIGAPIQVVIGRTGLAWGIGLYPTPSSKVEGDGKSPAGVFSLGTAFGFAPHSEMSHLKIDYLQLNANIEAVDDSLSKHYNHIVNTTEVTIDWHSSEKMGSEPLYELGLVVNHNFPNPQPGSGSAIFFHIWRDENKGTAGCTAMSHENMIEILAWLDRNKNPLLVQLPIDIYSELQKEWNLRIALV